MLNAEKYKNEILETIDGFENYGVTERNQIIMCEENGCCICQFCKDHFCDNKAKTRWLLSEYKEKIILFELEYVILKFIHKEGFKYIARDKDGNLFAFRFKPKKSGDIWDCDIKYNISYANDLIIFNKLLKFVKWEDTEPRSIEELLQNCEVKDK